MVVKQASGGVRGGQQRVGMAADDGTGWYPSKAACRRASELAASVREGVSRHANETVRDSEQANGLAAQEEASERVEGYAGELVHESTAIARRRHTEAGDHSGCAA